MKVAEAVGRELAGLGVSHVFGVVGSGNFHVTESLIRHGARFVAARHEGGAATMADIHARLTGRVAALSLHQGPGLTNALTGITEAAKSRTPLLVLAGDTPAWQRTSNFWIDQEAVIRALGAEVVTLTSPVTAVSEVARAYWQAAHERRTIVVNLPLDVQEREVPDGVPVSPLPELEAPAASAAAVDRLSQALMNARRPVFVAGRGARHASGPLRRLAEQSGALLATSAVARGLFAGDPWSVDVMGGFASPAAAALIADADLIVAWGASLNRWTTRDGTLVGSAATIVHVDDDPGAIGRHRPVHLGIVADVAAVALQVGDALDRADHAVTGYRTTEVHETIATRVGWRNVPYEDQGDADCVDPRTLSFALDDILPRERVVVPDSGNFCGYPSMFLSVPDNDGFCMSFAFMSVGLGLSGSIGAALARPDRLAVAGVGDGGFLMGLSELETAVRLRLPLVVLVYNDSAYGAEVHHFADGGFDLSAVVFPQTDLAAIARGVGCEAITVRGVDDLGGVKAWLDGPRAAPLVIDAKIASFPCWFLADAIHHE
ncbi:thiamine pyrophosphate-binding protein [Streptomyces griseiscabiei]|uniref:Thiamine pyrophosphate-binding protein n=1 Tax=Streptomyces griseiscabiei TaxID=2993540 RepID=A0ABU4LMD6_9ACTN|nr:thiamine pyrophosphate-binding protein [Streptomyces griseiscabiei]MBZ3900355.1 thiamine pyrophosphate-binding protein [Streptomyces griseiscabiei]MDX2916314.1 thiamine pyrophosphate-binding protein [Streptomyces griseiscabiei]